MNELQSLFELQQIEEKLDQLEKQLKKLPVFAEFKALQVKAADAKEAHGWADTKLAEHRKRVKRLDEDLQKAEQKHKELQSNLYAGDQSAKELEQLERKAATLQQEKEEHEETVIAAMEGTEELEKALEKSKVEYTDISKELRVLQKSGNQKINELKKEILANREKRDQLASQISEPLLNEYRAKRKEFNGRPLARVERELCGGCRVSVSSTVQSSLHIPDCKVSCENCGRILVKL
ncbi:zinc ribbon domain-containing protein [Dethiobacter alkaliphilus]|uniref:CT398-like coiled coil hairpin domain-containing protein n=1 Tax=Dethiobacter alkaliphilus AHT 1 TaxID=555088 RepID=C0GC07_DETAL|nr:DUF164 domain-containing protein [Dethiobacter alkaliphilus]EEG78742.1 protein of unknown function DUF164 [Dethiobacter alkaliphilus AHT 1]